MIKQILMHIKYDDNDDEGDDDGDDDSYDWCSMCGFR